MKKAYKLPPKFKENWLAGLRGRKYKQATDALCVGPKGRCCLGVAYEVNGGKWDGETTKNGSDSKLVMFQKVPLCVSTRARLKFLDRPSWTRIICMTRLAYRMHWPTSMIIRVGASIASPP